MNARRAQDILRHLSQDEDYGMAMMEKVSVGEGIEVLTKLLPECIQKAKDEGNMNDSGYFGTLMDNLRPVIIEKIKEAEHLWVVYSDNTGYPYIADGNMFVLYDFFNHKDVEDRLNMAGYNVAFQAVNPEEFMNEVAHMYRNGYNKVLFTDGVSASFEVEREELYSYDKFFKDDYMLNPDLQNTMITYFQEVRKTKMPGADQEKLLDDRERKMIKAMYASEYMVPCIKEETDEEIEIAHPFVDLTDAVKDKEEGEKVIAIPVFSDGFELDKCYEGHHENMLYKFEELLNLVEELGASGIVINCLGISYYMNKEVMGKIIR